MVSFEVSPPSRRLTSLATPVAGLARLESVWTPRSRSAVSANVAELAACLLMKRISPCLTRRHKGQHIRSISLLAPGNRERNGSARRTCSKWPHAHHPGPGSLHGSLQTRHEQEDRRHHVQLPACQGWDSYAPDGRPSRRSSSARLFQRPRASTWDSQPGRVRGPGSGSTAWSPWCEDEDIRSTRGLAACLLFVSFSTSIARSRDAQL